MQQQRKLKGQIYSVRRLKLWLRWKGRSVRASRVSGRDKHALHKQAKHRVQATRVWWKPPKVDQSLSEIDVRSVLLGTRATKDVLSLFFFCSSPIITVELSLLLPSRSPSEYRRVSPPVCSNNRLTSPMVKVRDDRILSSQMGLPGPKNKWRHYEQLDDHIPS